MFTIGTTALIVTHAEAEWGCQVIKKDLDDIVAYAADRDWQIVFLSSGAENTWVTKNKRPYKDKTPEEEKRLFHHQLARRGLYPEYDIRLNHHEIVVAGALWNRCVAESCSSHIKNFFISGNQKGAVLKLHFFMPAIAYDDGSLFDSFKKSWDPHTARARYEAGKKHGFKYPKSQGTWKKYLRAEIKTALKRLVEVMFGGTAYHDAERSMKKLAETSSDSGCVPDAVADVPVLVAAEKGCYRFDIYARGTGWVRIFPSGPCDETDENSARSRVVKMYFHSMLGELATKVK